MQVDVIPRIAVRMSLRVLVVGMEGLPGLEVGDGGLYCAADLADGSVPCVVGPVRGPAWWLAPGVIISVPVQPLSAMCRERAPPRAAAQPRVHPAGPGPDGGRVVDSAGQEIRDPSRPASVRAAWMSSPVVRCLPELRSRRFSQDRHGRSAPSTINCAAGSRSPATGTPALRALAITGV